VTDNFNREPMLEMFIFETTQNVEQLEQLILNGEKNNGYSKTAINEIFRIMHTIKGSSAMMLYNDISTLAHSLEDMFFFLREEEPHNVDYHAISDLVLAGVDYIKTGLEMIKNNQSIDENPDTLNKSIQGFLNALKGEGLTKEAIKKQDAVRHISFPDVFGKRIFKANLYFDDGCEMENIRAFMVIQKLKEIANEIRYEPEDITENDECAGIIRSEGFKISIGTDSEYNEVHKVLMDTLFLKDLELVEINKKEESMHEAGNIQAVSNIRNADIPSGSSHQSIISVNVTKLDMLMDLIGELVISEAMVVQNPDLAGLSLDNFQKAARQHRKIIGELQDIALSIRMVPLSATFHKMNRIVRDMSQKLSKEVRLEIIGEETEVDKNIIEHISDPLMHLIRNSIDHGIEPAEERKAKGKPEIGTIVLEAKNAGGDVLIIVKDNGKGLNKEKILARAKESGLLGGPGSGLTDKEIYSYIFLPGFSTNEQVTEFSGRGVGMDVVTKNLEAVGGNVSVDSVPDNGTTITLKIPLTLAIMDGMTVRVGKSTYTIPIISIKESFKVKEDDVITDPAGNEMILIRGRCYPVLRLNERYEVKTDVTSIPDGIMIMVENEDKGICLLADELIGEQQVVVKALPDYIKNIKKVTGLAGCTLLGDGSISLILDVAGLIKSEKSMKLFAY
jgi:two-component system, chemotaxis family, sensor kinase CheA